MAILALSPLLAVASPLDGRDRSVARARAACHAPVGARPRLEGIAVEPIAAARDDLPKLRITDERSGGWMFAFYDPASLPAAKARAACLGAQLRLLGAALGRAPARMQWHSVTFTTVADYVSPRGVGTVRWTIPVERDGRLGREGSRMVLLTMPHEQVHLFQRSSGGRRPRWFEEGQAEWISRKVKRALAPSEAAESEADYACALARSSVPTALAGWGGTRVKRSAIMRQVSPEERVRMQADPGYVPDTAGRSFRIAPGDMEGDEGNTQARYEAATRIFEELEASAGFTRARDWANGIAARRETVSTRTIETDVQVHLGFDLSKRLAATEAR